MGVYRIHGASYWLGKPFVDRTFEEIHAFRTFLKVFAPEHRPALLQNINRRQFWLVDAYLAKPDLEAARGAFWDAVRGWPRHRGERPRKVARYFLELYSRSLLLALRRLRDQNVGKPKA